MRTKIRNLNFRKKEIKPVFSTLLIFIIFLAIFAAVKLLIFIFGVYGNVWLDEKSYAAQGGIAYINGSEFVANSQVQLDIKNINNKSVFGYPKKVIADGSGNIFDIWKIPDDQKTGNYTLTAFDKNDSAYHDAFDFEITQIYQKIKEDTSYNVILDSKEIDENKNLTVVFHHNGASAKPIAITGHLVNYTLDKTIAAGYEKVTLTVPNWNYEWFRIKVGTATEILEFGKRNNNQISSSIKDASGKKLKTKINIVDSDTGETVFNETDDTFSGNISDGKYSVVVEPENSKVKKIKFSDVDVKGDMTKIVGIDEPADTQEFDKIYAIDPTSINFENATVTVTAVGNTLYKCKNWNFESQTCSGEWVFHMPITPGEDYTFTLTPDDPGFGEVNIITYYLHNESDSQYTAYKKINTSGPDIASVQSGAISTSAGAGVFCWVDKWITPNSTSLFRVNGTWNFTIYYSSSKAGATATIFSKILKVNSTGEFNFANSSNSAAVGGITAVTPVSWSYALPSSEYTNILSGERIGIQICIDVTKKGGGNSYINWETGTASNVNIPVSIYDPFPNVSLISPANGTFTTNNDVSFSCNATDDIQLSNLTLYWNYSGTWQSNGTAAVSGTSNSTTFARTNLADKSIIWNCYVCDNSSYCSFAASNWTFTMSSPNITWINQTPADVTSMNIIGTPLVITYNIADLNGINANTIAMQYKVNTTTSDCSGYVNGSASPCSYQTRAIFSNNSDSWIWHLYDNQVYPAVYNYNETELENTQHTTYNLTDKTKDLLKVRFFNVSSTKQYSFFEFMAVNRSSASLALRVWYCNSSYTAGSPVSSTFCTNFYSLLATTPYNHTHTAYSSHHVATFAMDPATGLIGNVKVTPVSYFLFDPIGDAEKGWNIYYITNVSRADTTQVSINRGTAWINLSGTVDAHLHQYDGTDTLYYYACANDTLGNGRCNSARYDLLNLSGIPPTPPYVYAPAEGYYAGNITINYTAALSPNQYSISYYNISLVYPNGTFVQTIQSNNSVNLSYVWDSTPVTDGEYLIRVEACDSMNQCAYGYSGIIKIDKIAPNTTLVSPANGNTTSLTTINFTCNATDNFELSNITLYWNYSGAWQSNGTTTISGTSNSTTFEKTGLGIGSILWNCEACDQRSQCSFASQNWTVTIIDATAPAAVTDLNETEVGLTWIFWNWTNPADSDFNSAIIYINGTNAANTSNNYYNATGLSCGTNYAITINTKDNSGNINYTNVTDVAMTSACPDTTPPNVTLSMPPEDYYNGTVLAMNLTFECNATDDAQLKNISLYITDSTNQSFTLNRTSDISGMSNSTSWILSLDSGNYTWNCLAHDTAGNSNWGSSNRSLKIKYAIAPSVFGLQPASGTQYNISDSVNISVDVTSAIAITSVTAQITQPDGTNISLNMANISQKYSALLTDLLQRGNYTITIIATDYLGNTNNSVTAIIERVPVVQNTTFDVIDSDETAVDYTQTIVQNDSGIINVLLNFTNYTIDSILLVGHNESNPSVAIRISNWTNDQFTKTFAIDVSDADISYANVTVTAVGNTLYKCSNFTFDSLTCNEGYERYVDLVPGQTYTFTINATDPGFGDPSPDTGTPDAGTYTSFGDGYSGTSNTYTATQTDDGTTFGVRQVNGGNAQLDLNAYLDLSYNLTNLTVQGVTSGKILNMTFLINHCYVTDNSGAVTCGTAPGGAIETNMPVQLFNWSSGSYVTVGTYNGSSTNEGNATVIVTSGFSDFINSTTNFISIRWKVNVSITVNGNDAALGVDYAPLTVVYDITSPVINSITDTPDPVDPGSVINFTANVTDNIAVSSAWVGINGTNYTMTRQGITDIWYYDTFNTTLLYAGTHNYTVYANDTKNNHAIPQTGNFTINTLVAINLFSAPINFTSVQAGQTINASVGQGWPVYVKNTGNVYENISLKGENLTGLTNPGYIIDVSRVHWDTDINFPTDNILTRTYTSSVSNLGMNLNQSIYFRLHAPLNIMSQNYLGNVSFNAVQS